MQFMSHGETKWMARILEVIGGVKEKGMSINRCHMEEKGEWTCVPEYPDLEPPKEDKKNPPREDRYSANSAFNLLAPSTRRISSGVWVPMIRDDFDERPDRDDRSSMARDVQELRAFAREQALRPERPGDLRERIDRDL